MTVATTTRPRRSTRKPRGEAIIRSPRSLEGIDNELVLGLTASVDAILCSSPHRWSVEDMDTCTAWIDTIESLGFAVLADELLEQLITLAVQERQSPVTRKGRPNRPR